MKKSLSILLSIAMAFSIFASVAMGAEANLDVNAKYNALVEAGIFTGDGDDQAANLDHTMTRAQFATVLVRTFGLSEDVAASSVYTDLDGAGWAAGFIGAVTKAGLMNGRSATGFAPSEPVKIEELAIVLVRAFDLQESTSGVTGTVDDWARGYVGAALQAGLIGAKADYTVDALRADLVESAYVVYQIILGLQTPEVTFKATSSKTIEIAFSKPVDKDKVTVEVKNSVDAAVASSVKEWSADNTKVTIETNTILLSGVYSITVKGAAAKDLTGSVTIEEERVAAIEILSDVAPAILDSNHQMKQVQVFFRVVNQYGQDVTRANTVNWTSSLGIPDTTEANKGILTFNLPDPNFMYRVGSEFTLFGNIFQSSNVTVNATLTIGEAARASDINVIGLYHPTDKSLNIEADYNEFVILFEAKDQYGNPVPYAKVKEEVKVFSSNPYLASVNDPDNGNVVVIDENQGPDLDKFGLRIFKAASNPVNMGGTATISFSPMYYSNKTVTYDLEVAKASEVVSLTLGNPTGVVAVNDVDVLIPVTAIDQDGKEITKASIMDTTKGANVQATSGTAVFHEKDGKLYVKYNPAAAYVGPTMINTFVKVNGQTSQLQLNIRDAKLPASISAMTAVDTTLAGVTNGIKGEHFTVLDQYGFEMTKDTFFANYALKLVDSTVSGNTYEKIADKNTTIVNVTRPTKGTVTLNVSAINKDGSAIVKGNNANNNTNYTVASQKDFVFRFVEWADVASFDVSDIAKVYDRHSNTNFDGNAPAVTVTGKTAAGTKVNIGKVADGNFTLATSTKGIKIDGDKVTNDGTGANYGAGDIETKGLVVVTILKDKATQNVTKEVVISKATPVVAKVELKDISITEADINKNVKDGLLKDLKLTDQYGTVQASFKDSVSLTVSEVTKASGSTLSVNNGTQLTATSSISGAVAGDTFKITVVTGFGSPSVAKVTVK